MHWESDSKMDFISYLFFVIVFILGTVSNVESLFPKMGLNLNGRLPNRKATKAGFQMMNYSSFGPFTVNNLLIGYQIV